MYRSPLMNKAVIPVLALGALAYAVVATGAMRPKTISEPPLSPPPQRPFAHAIGAVGVVEPASELISIGPRVAGWIETVHTAAGENVSSGEPLFTLDTADLRAELRLRTAAVEVAQAKLARLRALPRPEDVPIARAAVEEAAARLADAESNLRFIEAVTDKRAVREEEVSQRRHAVARERGAVAARQGELDRLLAGAWKEDLGVAEMDLALARAAIGRIEADIERMTTRAPIDAVVLRSTARPGQYAASAGTDDPLMVLGSPGRLHVRADVNEQNVPRLEVGANAVAFVRGDGATQHELEFVRLEPLLVPKKALSGFATERVDTRVMQAIYRFAREDASVNVGQQVDVYIEEAARSGAGSEREEIK